MGDVKAELAKDGLRVIVPGLSPDGGGSLVLDIFADIAESDGGNRIRSWMARGCKVGPLSS
ncbi:hypothetical protein ACF07V_36385 [Streptomyces sp. NPDC015661]|uniref:hypothetical protein n=1 Tax=Streptomyces sp. NPDC015661 TaxID=3364961 RepID=UPI0036F822D0